MVTPCCSTKKLVDTLTLSEYILERLSSRSDIVLLEFRITRSFPKRFKYKMSVSARTDKVILVEESLGIVDSLYCLPSAKEPSHSGSP